MSRGAAVERAQDQGVHEADDRALRGQALEVPVAPFVLGHELKAQALAGLLEQQLSAAVAPQERGHAPRGSDHRFDRPLEQELELVDALDVLEAAEGQDEPRALVPQGHAGEADEQLERDLGPEGGVVRRGVEGREGEAPGLRLGASLLHVGSQRVGRGEVAWSGGVRHLPGS